MSPDWFWRITGRLALYATLCAVTFVVCFPLIWALSTSLKPKTEIFAIPPTLMPQTVTLENYAALLNIERSCPSRSSSR